MFVTMNDVFVDQSMEVKEVTRVVDLVERGPSHLRPVDDVADGAVVIPPVRVVRAVFVAVVRPVRVVPAVIRRPTTSSAPQAYVPETVRTMVVRVSSTEQVPTAGR